MTIEGSFYKLTPVSDSSPKFDLEFLRDIGGKNPRKEYKLEGYAFTLESAIKRIINYAINKKFSEEVITLKQYLDAYKEEVDKIKKELSNFGA